jgi:hypothetical protein
MYPELQQLQVYAMFLIKENLYVGFIRYFSFCSHLSNGIEVVIGWNTRRKLNSDYQEGMSAFGLYVHEPRLNLYLYSSVFTKNSFYGGHAAYSSY